MTRGVVFALLGATAWAQAPSSRFEAASVKATAPGSSPARPVATVDGARVWLRQPLQTLVCMAYQVRANQVAGPSWIARTWFDVEAKLPPGATPDQIPAMLQDLLAERFRMAVHREQREKPVYALVIAKGGIRMKPKVIDAGALAPSCAANLFENPAPRGEAVVAGDRRSVWGPDGARVEMSRIATLADVTSQFTDRPVIEKTNLEAGYDIKLDLPFAEGRSSDPTPGIDPVIVHALDKLGLKLEAQKAPVETIVVDRIDQAPTQN